MKWRWWRTRAEKEQAVLDYLREHGESDEGEHMTEKWDILHNTANLEVDLSKSPPLNVRMFAATVGDGESSHVEIRHDLNTQTLVAVYEIREEGLRQIHDVLIHHVDANVVRLENTYLNLQECGCASHVTKPIPLVGWRVVVMG